MAVTRPFTATEIVDSVKIGIRFYAANTSLRVSDADAKKITDKMLLDFDGVLNDEAGRQLLVNTLRKQFQALLDAEAAWP